MCNITGECYIGSTCQPTLAKRLTGHVNSTKCWKSGKGTKLTSFDIIDRGDYNILLIESFPCNSRDELRAREGEIIRQYKLKYSCVNRIVEGRTHKEWHEDNKDRLLKYEFEYRQNNNDKIK